MDNLSPLKTKGGDAAVDATYNLSSFNVKNMAQSPLGFQRKVAGGGQKTISDKKMSQGPQSAK